MYSLPDLGWGPFFSAQLNSEPNTESFPARVAEELKGHYRLYSERGEHLATAAGRMLHETAVRDGLPAVGDWVLARSADTERAVIQRVLRRRTVLSRRAAGERTEEQVLAANVDTVLLVTSLNQELNPRRIERYLSVIWESGARPVVVLSKSDLSEDAIAAARDVDAVAPGVAVLMTSAVEERGIESLRGHVASGQTAVFVGSSGVGKSSLINCLLETPSQHVEAIRDDDARGRHTTTSRQMLLLPDGGIVIDTPGLRELQLWETSSGLSRAFTDVEELASGCAFRDCTHANEPGCAVLEAIENGVLASERVQSYRKLEKEHAYEARRRDKSLALAEKRKWKQIHVANRERMKLRGR